MQHRLLPLSLLSVAVVALFAVPSDALHDNSQQRHLHRRDITDGGLESPFTRRLRLTSMVASGLGGFSGLGLEGGGVRPVLVRSALPYSALGLHLAGGQRVGRVVVGWYR